MAQRCVGLVALGVTIGAWTPGCTVTSASRDIYEVCGSGESCFASTCTPASATTTPGTTPGSLCTRGCTADTECAPASDGAPAVCRNGQCYRTCTGTFATCPAGEVCGYFMPGMYAFCLPGSGVACGGANQPCCTNNACQAGLTCSTTAGGTGLVCGTAAQTPTAYAGCSPVGVTCADNTQCTASIAPGSSTGAFCSLTCTGAASECPASPNGTVNCYVFAGKGQCFQDCQAGMACQAGTTCRAVMPDGVTGTVSICAP
jgi:hypothetical protein